MSANMDARVTNDAAIKPSPFSFFVFFFVLRIIISLSNFCLGGAYEKNSYGSF